MANRRIEMFEYRNVIVRMRQGDSDRQIAKAGLLSRHKAAWLRRIAMAQGWLDPQVSLPDTLTISEFVQRPLMHLPTSQVKLFDEQVLKWHEQGLSSVAIHQGLIKKFGFTGGYDAIRRYVRKHVQKQIKVTTILDFAPGEAAQIDFGMGPKLLNMETGEVHKTWFFVMTLAFSRHQYVEFVFDQTVETWIGCHCRAFIWFGGVPEKVIIDNPKCAITKACFHDPQVQRAYAECAEGFNFRIAPTPIANPQKKGIVESGVNYVKRNFLPLREFRSLEDLNRQAAEWVMDIAGNRRHGTTHEQPLRRFVETEQSMLNPLPQVLPEVVRWTQAKVHGNCHIMFQKVHYSVPVVHVHKTVWVRATEGLVQIFREEQLVASHIRERQAGRHVTIADHLPPAAQAYFMADPQYCLEQAEKIGESCLNVVRELFADRVLERLRAVQGILRLASKYGKKRLEKACAYAVEHNLFSYRHIKGILVKGLDATPIQCNFLDNIYVNNARFLRNSCSILQ